MWEAPRSRLVPSWQDVVLSVTAVVFLVSIVPSMLSRATRIPRTTTVPTALAAWAQGAVFLTLDLRFTGFLTLGIALAWTFLAVARAARRVSPSSTIA